MASISRNDVVQNLSIYSQITQSDIDMITPSSSPIPEIAAEVRDLYSAFVGGPSDATTQSLSQEFFARRKYSENNSFGKSLDTLKAVLLKHNMDDYVPTVDHVKGMVTKGIQTHASAAAAETVTREPQARFMRREDGSVVETRDVMRITKADPRQAAFVDSLRGPRQSVQISEDGSRVTTEDGKTHTVVTL